MNQNLNEVEYYKSLGINTNAPRFKRFKNAGLLDNVDESFVSEAKQFWLDNYNKKLDPVLHIAYLNLTGNKDPRVVHPRTVGRDFVSFFNEQRMKSTYRDKNLSDKLISSDRSVETILKRAHGLYFDSNHNGLAKENAIKEILSYQQDMIIKPSDTNNGKGIEKITYKEGQLFLSGQPLDIEDLEKKYGGNFAVQKVIKQHPIMAKPHPSSVNTLRMVTLRWNNEIKYLLTFARFGANNTVKDNAGAGGVCVGVTESGEFLETAIDEHCMIYNEHPSTGFKFKEMESIPNFEKFKDFVKELHKDIIHHDFVSWDIAVGSDGLPVFIEANFQGATWLYQLASQQPLFGDLTEEVLQHVYKERNDKNSPRKKRTSASKKKRNNNRLQQKQPKGNMLVGFMQRLDKPSKLAETTALMCSHYGMDLIYLNPWDVNTKTGMVKGKLYQNGEWTPVERELPKLIDATDACFKKDTKKLMSYLRKNSTLTYDRKNTLNKDELQEELSRDPEFSHLTIPTRTLEDFDTLESFLSDHGTIVIKPLNGSRGKDIHMLRIQDEKYVLGHGTEEKVLSRNELMEYYDGFLKDRVFLLQKYIRSRTRQGDPFDCRIHVQKNRKGEWEIAKMFVRIGIGQTVMSNVNQGGGIADPKPFLKANFGEKWIDIYKKLRKVGLTLPYKIEKLKGTPTMDFGLDIGIADDGELYLFESNRGATTHPLVAQSAKLRVEYYQYLREIHPEIDAKSTKENQQDIKNNKEQSNQSLELEKKIKQLEDEKNALIKEKNRYEKKYNDIMESNSWRITSPIRKAGSLIKRK